MKRAIVYILCCIFASSIVGQTVQIDSISGSQIRIPVSTNGIYSYSQQIIVKDKIIENGWSENAGNITRIRYHFNDLESLINSNNWKIYLGETDKNFFATTTDWEIIENMTLVYDGLITEPLSIGWYDIFLQTPFPYDGDRNLIIAIDENSPVYTPSHAYYSSYIDTVDSGIYFYSQGGGAINPDPLSPPAGNLTMSVPVLQLYFEEICPSPTSFTLSNLNATSADFIWVPQGNETSWNLRYRPINSPDWTTISEINEPVYSLTDLFSIESYIVQIQAACVDTVSEWINPIYFTTPEIPGFEYTVDWEIFKYKTEGDFSIMNDTFPDLVIKMDSLVTPDYSTNMDRFFSRIRGYIIPRTSGQFSFHFGSNDIGEFWLSTDESEANSVLAISNDTIQTDLSLNHYLQNLIEGNKYYFEILHYDTVYTDLIKLGWILPGDTIIRTLKTPFISSCGTNVPANNLRILATEITGYPESEHSITCLFTPWNVSDKRINWLSTNVNIATVDESGIVTLVSEGSCRIIGIMADNENATDTLNINVWNYPGPFFVKPGASKNSNGQSWESAIDLQTLLNILNTRIDNQIITVYASGGLYKPTEIIDRNITFSMKDIRFVGGFASTSSGTDTTSRNIENHETILSGEIGIPDETIDNSYHVVVIKGPSVIDGITISDGRASCSSYGFTPGLYFYKPDDNGGGILAFSDLKITNCKCVNNSAWNGGGGISCRGSWMDPPVVNVINTVVYGNRTQQQVYTVGGIFNIIVNGYGAGMSAAYCKVRIQGCHFSNNFATGVGGAIMYAGDTLNVEYSSFDNNPGSGSSDIFGKDGGHLNFNNVSINGNLTYFFVNSGSIYNSTINGNLAVNLIFQIKNNFLIDNSIIRGVNPDEIVADSVFEAKFCILGNSLFGASKDNLLYDSLPDHTLWLDSLAYNGGTTPTMKLKNIPGNYALNYGNPLYLDSTDQRGAIRTNFVSIGAYQWVDATEIVISPNQLTLTQGDSIDFEVYFLPAFVSDGVYTVSCSDNSIARVDSSKIYALTPGFVNIIVQSSDGALRDTLFCQVIANAGIEEVNPDSQFRVYPNPVAHELMIESKGNTGKVNFEVLNAFGQMVYEGSFTGQTFVNTSNLGSGLFLIKCTVGNTTQLMKVIKE